MLAAPTQVAQILEKDRAQLSELMNSMMEAYKEMSKEAADARMELADKNDRDRLAKEHEERIEKMNSEVSQLREFKQTQSSNMRSLLNKVDSIRSRNQDGADTVSTKNTLTFTLQLARGRHSSDLGAPMSLPQLLINRVRAHFRALTSKG